MPLFGTFRLRVHRMHLQQIAIGHTQIGWPSGTLGCHLLRGARPGGEGGGEAGAAEATHRVLIQLLVSFRRQLCTFYKMLMMHFLLVFLHDAMHRDGGVSEIQRWHGIRQECIFGTPQIARQPASSRGALSMSHLEKLPSPIKVLSRSRIFSQD